jgi:hypothetical protein
MKLLTEDLKSTLPRLYSQEHETDPMVYAKFFTPDSNWSWFVTEGQPDGDDFRFFGFVRGLEDEWGYFLLSELEAARGSPGLPVERDLYFQPGRFTDVVEAPE